MNLKKYCVAGILVCTAFTMMGVPVGLLSTSSYRPSADTVKTESETADNVVDQVLWVVGDEPILKSDLEMMRLQGEADGMKWKGNPNCAILEQIAVQKLFLHQAALDSINVTEAEITQGVEQQINAWIAIPQIASKEKLEEYQHKSIAQIRQDLHDDFKNRQLVQRMQEKLVGDVKVSPAEVREYFKKLPVDSIPMIPTTVEVQLITQTPRIEPTEVERIKNQLRDYTDRVVKGETSFETLARLYSEDPGSACQGGELGFMGRGMLDPTFAAAAFNLTDPKKVSKVVESEFGYHIIQLIDRRGDKLNCRHILLKPKVSADALNAATNRLDSIANDIKAGKFTFDEATMIISDDKETKNNHGLMTNVQGQARTSRFAMRELPSEIARKVENMKVGEVSEPFSMIDGRGKLVVVIVKLKSRIDEHRATITEDLQAMKDIVALKKRQDIIHNWIVKKVKDTYVRMSPEYRDCDFEYEGWIR